MTVVGADLVSITRRLRTLRKTCSRSSLPRSLSLPLSLGFICRKHATPFGRIPLARPTFGSREIENRDRPFRSRKRTREKNHFKRYCTIDTTNITTGGGGGSRIHTPLRPANDSTDMLARTPNTRASYTHRST